MNKINLESTFSEYEQWFSRDLDGSAIPNGFTIDIQINKNTIEFKMLDRNDVQNIIEIITTVVERIKLDEHSTEKKEFKEVFHFPFEAGSNEMNSLAMVSVEYNRDANHILPTVKVARKF